MSSSLSEKAPPTVEDATRDFGFRNANCELWNKSEIRNPKSEIPIVRPDRAAVIIIDMQNDFVHRDGAVMRYFRAKKDGRDIGSQNKPTVMEQMVPHLVQFIDAARQAEVPVIWVRTINDANTQSPFAAAQDKRFVWADDTWGTAFYEGLKPRPGEPVVTKHRHSAFFGTDLDLILGRLGVQTVILTGVSTPYCVESTARDAFARDYQVVSVADCTASKVLTEHEEALTRLGRVFGRVETAGRLVQVWEQFQESLLFTCSTPGE